VIKSKLQNLFSINTFSLLLLIDAKPDVWVANIKMQLRIATQMSVFNVKVADAKIEIQFPINNFILTPNLVC